MSNPKSLLQSFIRNSILTEAPRWKREGLDIVHPYEQMRLKYLGQRWVFFTMTEVNKTGIYPRSQETYGPFGIYAYPFVTKTYEEMLNNHLPFGGNRPYIRFFEIKKPENVLIVGNGYGYKNTITNEQATKLIKSLAPKSGRAESESVVTSEQVESYLESHMSGNPAEFIYEATREFTSNNAIRWSQLLRKLGFCGVADFGTNTIYSGEPDQGVFFTAADLVDLETIPNYHHSGDNSRHVGALSNYDAGSEEGSDHYPAGLPKIRTRIHNVVKSTKVRFETLISEFINKNLQIKTKQNLFANKEYVKMFLSYMQYDLGISSDFYMMVFDRIPKEWVVEFIDITKDSRYLPSALIAYLSVEQLPLLFKKNLSKQDVIKLLKRIKNDRALLEQYAQQATEEVLPNILNYLPATALPAYINYPNEETRMAVASRVDVSQLPELMNDQSSAVRAVVADRIDLKNLAIMAKNEYNHYVITRIVKRLPDDVVLNDLSMANDVVALWAAKRAYSNLQNQDVGEVEKFLHKLIEARPDQIFLEKLYSELSTHNISQLVPFMAKMIPMLSKESLVLMLKMEVNPELYFAIYRALDYTTFEKGTKDNYYFYTIAQKMFPMLSQEELSQFVRFPLDSIRARLATYLESPYIDLMVDDYIPEVKREVAKKTQNIEILKKLSITWGSYGVVARERLANFGIAVEDQ